MWHLLSIFINKFLFEILHFLNFLSIRNWISCAHIRWTHHRVPFRLHSRIISKICNSYRTYILLVSIVTHRFRIFININNRCTLIKSSDLTRTIMFSTRHFGRHSLDFLFNVLWILNYSLQFGFILVHLHLIKRHVIRMLSCAMTFSCSWILGLTVLCLASDFINVRDVLVDSVCDI